MTATIPIRSSTTRVESDAEGLRVALREIFEESFILGATEDVFSSGDLDAMRRVEEDIPARTLSPGYYSRAAYLLELAGSIDCGVTYAPHQLTHDDVRGLEMVKRAKAAFESEHPPCPGCGRRLDAPTLSQCPYCQTKFAGRGN